MKNLALIALAAALLCPTVARAAGPAGAPDPAPQADTDEADATVEAVGVQLRIKSGSKQVGKLAGLVGWDQPTELVMDVDGHRHVTSVTVRKQGDTGRKFKVALAYHLDGNAMLETVEVDAAAARKKVVRSADGKIAIALTLAPQQVAAGDVTPKTNSHRIALPGSNDPLAGLPSN